LKENKGAFFRLPMRGQKSVRQPVWDLAQCPASANIAFRSDTTSLVIKALTRDAGHMSHMTLVGSNGLALFAGNPGCKLRLWRTAGPDQGNTAFERVLLENLPKKMREFRLYLPLYKALDKLELGLTPGAVILPPSPYALPKPVVFYGTSITQGGCANTAGTDFVSSLGRMLNLNMINLGFSGNGRGEPELARLIAEIDASLYVLDYAANTNAGDMRKTLPAFIKILRAARPKTPIMLVSQISYAALAFDPGTRERIDGTRECMMENYLRQRRKGDANIYFTDGAGLIPFGADNATVDGAHPTDHGFQLMAERLAPAIERILMADS